MIGYEFRIENEWGKYLEKIFENIDHDNYFWKVDEEEILTKDNTDFFDKHELTSKEFQKIISEREYYTIFINIKLFLKKISKEEIRTFESYMNSNCILVLLIIDNEYVEVFSKDKNLLKQIKENIIANDFKITKEITFENNTRTIFSL